MAERQRQSNGGSLWRAGLAAALVVLISASVYGLWRLGDRRSADERLAEIEATRTVPDAGNAAIIYDELLQDARATSLSDSRPDVLNGPLFSQKRDEPWRTKDCPELAAWIDKCSYILDKLAKASELDACRFPISIDIVDTSTMARASPMRQWTFLLLLAASNDLAEGRIDAAVTKWRCVFQMSNHLRQQPVLMDHLIASGMAELVLRSIARFLATGNPSERHLQQIQAMPLQLTDDWEQHLREIRVLERLMLRKMKEPFGLWDRVRFPFYAYRMNRSMNSIPGMPEESPIEATGNAYRRNIAIARGLCILIALRRHRNETGRWPQSLAEINSSLPETILTDPLSGGSFVYRRTEDAFELYSKGKNKTDETVRRSSDNGDDWPVWIPPAPAPPSSDGQDAIMNELKAIYGERDITRPQADTNAP